MDVRREQSTHRGGDAIAPSYDNSSTTSCTATTTSGDITGSSASADFTTITSTSCIASTEFIEIDRQLKKSHERLPQKELAMAGKRCKRLVCILSLSVFGCLLIASGLAAAVYFSANKATATSTKRSSSSFGHNIGGISNATAEVSTTQMSTAGVSTTQMSTAEVSTTQMSTAGVSTTQMSTAEVSTTQMSTAGVSTTQMSTAEVSTTQMSTAEVSTTQETMIAQTSAYVTSMASTIHAPTTTYARKSTYCTTTYYLNKRCDNTSIILRPSTEAFFLLDPDIFNNDKNCSGSFEISADHSDRVVLWMPLVYHAPRQCSCSIPEANCTARVNAKFETDGEVSTIRQCSGIMNATYVSYRFSVIYSIAADLENTTLMFYRAIEAIKLKEAIKPKENSACFEYHPFLKYCEIGRKPVEAYCIHPDVPCYGGEVCQISNNNSVVCNGYKERVGLLLSKATDTLSYKSFNVTYVFPGSKAIYVRKEDHFGEHYSPYYQRSWSFRSGDSRIKLAVKSTEPHAETGCSAKCAKGDIDLGYRSTCTNAVLVEAASTVVGAYGTSTNLLCDPQIWGLGNKSEILGSAITLSVFKQKLSTADANFTVAPICGTHCTTNENEAKDCFGLY